MAQSVEVKDEWTNVRVRVSLIDEIKSFMKKNQMFDNPTQVVDFAVKQLLERGMNK